MNTKRSIEEQVRAHYESQKLPESTLEELRMLRRAAETGHHGGRRSWSRWLAVAAAVLLALGGGTLWLLQRAAIDPAEELARIAAHDHNRRLAVEIETNDYTELQARMTNLDFNPVMPERLAEAGLQVVGARYSTIDGVAAVQIKLREPTGGVCTLIQAKGGQRLGKIGSPRQFVIDGLHIEVWSEKGLVMALARTA